MKWFPVLLTLLAAPALAQPLSPEQQNAATLGQQIGLLSHENATLRSQLQQAQRDLTAANAKVQELEQKQKAQEPEK